jgi:hypothetical protein
MDRVAPLGTGSAARPVRGRVAGSWRWSAGPGAPRGAAWRETGGRRGSLVGFALLVDLEGPQRLQPRVEVDIVVGMGRVGKITAALGA